ncbi:hypothetical protein A3K34_04270 [candidate division WWE3 bacterium RIFOXYC1_FULL_40_10]|uniref:Sec-independent protein translocase protein TatC n=1 Tax=candidate division WWE3 bacterium RIFOXYA2_FULL_46_9 TaxID=1802636 RepID=A0A1F4W0W1_UNCKA|nr:MAG: hypothetical protein A3K58_04270 [candidate division WWE3 bacterium RIFOXYB1_FULL_40_22]OGC62057.1 MAG: hypothetical protein A3K37_04270 [candidate division WWE3 bacterium RIFOXYA1_FULL_40_11]OGC62975.1 MAG: hypothetical protein A2264_03795 [candidate division WWE3 bacterium RIFOXYA2_FULL_46_9]OGC64998.1 MAG: hypothetical protein A2326_03095 [candidate division WWE3 bacterium RIFOXYB2_FULL_41_6]OGC66440.1 MAG: hypothetical protein A3K34_04270 [candidate division WWE3 bacterium RIFOXYC1_
MTRYDHYLASLRKIALVVGAFFIVAFCLGFGFSKNLLVIFLKIFNLTNIQMTVTSPLQVFNLSANTGFLVAIVITLPVVVFLLARFVLPALNKGERRLVATYSFLALVLFFVGFIFGVLLMKFVIFTFADLLYGTRIGNYWDIQVFISQVLITATMLGLVFEFPIVLAVLVKVGILELEMLISKRPYIFACAIIFVALLPPTDVLSMVAMVVPLVLLFEITIFCLKKTRR